MLAFGDVLAPALNSVRQFAHFRDDLKEPRHIPILLREQRLECRHHASKANLAVLESLIIAQEPLAPDERACSVALINEGDLGDIISHAAWKRLETLLSSTVAQDQSSELP